ncbi:hypothetical protein BDA99DRAFT_537000 [Phascolomyces articulosus]|uniref:Heterokaryon incompatibility domain-containing protein n=1 Tax=Phascolomyces articulosus TaxID=60185 RepID=A0AAD5K141_9FUNG|nr:hypothetical protein BDA99DRAFT_537000 [Phascolomyces articulosus]
MYFKYDIVHRHKMDNLLRRFPDVLPQPDFMPSKLVFISDMKVVNGSQAKKGHCALSYSWNQSGDMIPDEANEKLNMNESNVNHVEFKGTILRLCNDFNIKYIWFNQWCINQNDKEEKKRKIRTT